MASEPVRTCIDVLLPEDQVPDATRRAIEENPQNVEVPSPAPGAPVPNPRLATVVGKRWRAGRTIRVRFLEGEPSVQSKVEKIAKQWEKHANIRFDFVQDGDAEIRISFQPSGSWSYIGTDALSIPRGQATMNYGWLTPTTSDEEYSRVVLHEFGHALGCIHEHQSPAADIPWDREAVYRLYMGPPNNWTRDQVDVNLFQRYSRMITQYSQFDRDSIMLYPVPEDLTRGNYSVGWNTKLSPTDEKYIGRMYPGKPDRRRKPYDQEK
jgi:hypothetical protein